MTARLELAAPLAGSAPGEASCRAEVAGPPPAPFPVACPPPAPTPNELARLQELGAAARRALDEAPDDPAALHVAALQHLLWAERDGQLERAESLLSRAAGAAPAAAAPRVDLAVLHLLRAQLRDEPGRLPDALALADEALSRAPRSAAAAAGRALALEGLGLRAAAAGEWKAIEGRPEEALATAAGRHRNRLEEASRGLDGDDAAAPTPRERAEAHLAEWGRRRLERRDDAGAPLAAAGRIAGDLAAAGDPLLADSVRLLHRAGDDPQRAAELARGHAALGAARRGRPYSDCSTGDLASAEAALGAAGTPFAAWAWIDRAICHYFAKRFDAAEPLLARAATLARDRRYLALEGRARWILGLVRMVQGRFWEAREELGAAAGRFAEAGERAHVVYLDALLAKTLRFLGEDEAAWEHRVRALRGRHAAHPERAYTIVAEASECLRDELHPAAGHLLAEQLRAARRAADASGTSELPAYVLLERARWLLPSDREGAAADVAGAARLLRDLPSAHENRRWLEVEVAAMRAVTAPAPLFGEVEAAIDAAIDFFRGRGGALGDRVEILRLHRLRAAAARRLGRAAAAGRDLDAAITLVESQRLLAESAEGRARFLATAEGLYDDRIALELDAGGDPAIAWRWAERKSHRLLAERIGEPLEPATAGEATGAPGPPHTSTAPAGRTLRVTFLPDRAVTWTAAGAGLEARQLRRPRPEIEALASAHRRALLGGDEEEARRLGARLSDLLLPAELADGAAEGEALTLVPDPRVPLVWAALPVENRPLAERFTLRFAPGSAPPPPAASGSPRPPPSRVEAVGSPTATLPPRGGAEGGPAGGARDTAGGMDREHAPTVLLVADPAFDRHAFPGLDRLPAARAAAQRLARHHRRSVLLAGAAATRGAVLAALGRADVVHLAAHALPDRTRPPEGGVLLAPDSPTSPHRGLLTAADLADRRLTPTLVVLAGCTTRLGTWPGTGEVAGLAAALLAGGVDAVVTTDWPIDDRTATHLFDPFHRQLAAGADPATALRAAQLHLAASDDPELARPGSWAGYRVVVGPPRGEPPGKSVPSLGGTADLSPRRRSQ